MFALPSPIDDGMNFSLEDSVAAMGARATTAFAGAPICTGVTTDSRAVAPGSLFFALRGERFDGHGFVAEALRNGAAAAVVEVPVVGVDPQRLIRVDDTLHALGDLAAWVRRLWPMRVVAITGSNGKTTTKDMIGAICRVAYPPPQKVLQTQGNLNNLIGLPLTLLRADGDEVVGVLEMGMNRPGEIARMTEIARPDFAVVTNVGRAHLERLGSLAGVAAAKGEVFAGLPNDAVIAVNCDDEWVVRISERFKGKRVTFGCAGEVRAEDVYDHGTDGVAFTLVVGGSRVGVMIPIVGRHNVSNALAAAAVAHAMGIGAQAIAAGLQQPAAARMRMEVLNLDNGVTVINDAYNANPTSMKAALEAIRFLPGRSVVVVGDMQELGVEGRRAHRELGECAATLGVQELIALGSFAPDVADAARASGLAAAHVHVCETHADAAAIVRRLWQRGDVVLVKGSRAMRMEQVVQLLEEAGRAA